MKDTKEEIINNVETLEKGKEASNLTKPAEDMTSKDSAGKSGAIKKLCEAIIAMVVIFVV